MLVSHNKKFIFLKTVKTASTSIEQSLQQYCSEEKIYFSSEQEDSYSDFSHIESYMGIITKPLFFYNGNGEIERDYYWDHMTGQELKSKISSEIWNTYFKFCCVRNPFDKVLSMFYFAIRNTFVGENIPIQTLFEFHLPNILRCSLYFDSIIYLIDGKLCVDDIIKYETLHQDYDRICKKLGIDVEILPKINSQYRPKTFTCKDVYTDVTKKLVQEKYSFELDYFGYKFPE